MPWHSSHLGRLPRTDVVISLNYLISKQFLTRHFGPDCRYLHWHQNDARSAYGARFGDSALWRHVDKFIFVSRYQASDFIARFGIPSSRTTVIGNPVAECFRSLFPEGRPILAAKDPDLLIYASAPNRGLDSLVHTIFPELRKSRPRLRLEVYSGFYLDQGMKYAPAPGQGAARDEEGLLNEAARAPGVTVSRGVPKQQLA